MFSPYVPSPEQLLEHPELASLATLDSALLVATTALVAVHGRPEPSDDRPHYPETPQECIAECIEAAADSLRQMLAHYRHATDPYRYMATRRLKMRRDVQF